MAEGDVVFSDQFNHASIVDGLKLSKAQRVVYRHNDLLALREKLETTSVGQGATKLIVTESLFSMDGDLAPLRELAALAEEFSCHLVVDEAHATGLYGDFVANRGAGLVQALGLQAKVFATVHTGGKALGAAGAWVTGSHELTDYLVNFSRPFIFSTAPQPSLAVLLSLSLDYWREVGATRALKLRNLSETFFAKVQALNKFALKESTGPIIPLILGENERALAAAKDLQSQGFDVRAIRPPTVTEGTSRLRVTLRSEIESSILENFLLALGGVK